MRGDGEGMNRRGFLGRLVAASALGGVVAGASSVDAKCDEVVDVDDVPSEGVNSRADLLNAIDLNCGWNEYRRARQADYERFYGK